MRLLSQYRRARVLKKSVRQNVTIGRDFSIGANCVLWAPASLRLGNGVKLGSHVRIEVDGSIGDGVLIANCTGIVGRSDHDITQVGTPVTQTRWVGRSSEELSHEVVIGSDVWIGYGVTILSGVVIGDSSVVGAGSVVTRDIPENSIAVGNPARVIGTRFESTDFVKHWEMLEGSGYRKLLPTSKSAPEQRPTSA